MAVTDELATYLNDHLSGAVAGVDLIKRISEEMNGALYGLVADIETDRAFLEDVLKALDIREHAAKQALSSVMEKLGQLKMNRVVSGNDQLALLLKMEAMSMGIEGKRCLWQTLESVAPGVPEMAETDFAAMVLRAQDQRDRLEAHRRAVAVAANLAAPPSGAG